MIFAMNETLLFAVIILLLHYFIFIQSGSIHAIANRRPLQLYEYRSIFGW